MLNSSIADAWKQLQENRVFSKRSGRARHREPIGMRRYSVDEVARIFGCSVEEIRTKLAACEFDSVTVDGYTEIFLPDPIPEANREEYERLWEQILSLLAADDPAGLVAFGASGDEYAPEVGTIIPRLEEARGPEDVARFMKEEFASWFSPRIAGDETRYTNVARKVWNDWQKRSWNS